MSGAVPVLEVGLGLGSNLGDRVANFRAAKSRLLETPGLRLLARSSLYETEPVGVKPEYQHLKFINAVLVVSCAIPLEDLHQACLRIEAEIGRQRSAADRYAPRPLDIDVLFAGDLVQDTPGLRLPHPQCLKRRFVLEPLAEIRPGMILAGTEKHVLDLLAALPQGEAVTRLDQAW